MSKEYKYKCRECPPHVRKRCIEGSQISPGIRRIIDHAFEGHTDTQDTWDLLQRSCLLVERDRMIIGLEEAEQHGLMDRMNQRKQETAPPTAPQEERPPVGRPSPPARPDRSPVLEANHGGRDTQAERPLPQRPVARPRPRTTVFQEQTRRRAAERTTVDISRIPIEPPASVTAEPPARPVLPLRYPPAVRPEAKPMLAHGPRMLVAAASGHRILLRQDGTLILGRFDPLTRTTPDVDLTFEDRWYRTVSRRHVQINGWHGQYQVSDLGSSNGTWINGKRLALNEESTLQVGDEVKLGACILYFDQVPASWRQAAPTGQHFLYATFKGHFFALPDLDTMSIGRTDESLGYIPEIDLGAEGEAASVVSRRHAKITRREADFYVEDLGSAFKTRLDGEPIHVGMQVPIRPGQHLWLGGCTLAFDVVAESDLVQ